MPPVTRSQLRPQPQKEPLPQKPHRPPPGDRYKASRTKAFWEGRKKDYLTDPLFLLGQHFARTVHPFAILKTVIKIETMAVRRLEKRSETWRQGMHHREERRDHRTFLALQQLLLLQGEDLAGSSIAVQSHIVDLVSRGQAKAWSEDLVKANDLLSQRLGDDLCGRGFDDDTIGRMLCPINLDWYKEEYATPKFLTHPTDIGKGPTGFAQSTTDDHCSVLANNTLPKYGISVGASTSSLQPYQGLSLNSIAYIATLVITALASDSSAYVSRQDRNLFTLLSNHLYEYREDRNVKELILWWDRQLGNHYFGRIKTAPLMLASNVEALALLLLPLWVDGLTLSPWADELSCMFVSNVGALALLPLPLPPTLGCWSDAMLTGLINLTYACLKYRGSGATPSPSLGCWPDAMLMGLIDSRVCLFQMAKPVEYFK
ncbi:hypothetical protein BKA70DRAFT_1562894 [Coprinopsis sp. MPI-PUGE-AT-0042]|nr:hypothetical protein BKA70DRAFT_1562894 [Coprinopsis sp. MPI-PUGE-AT-0042]